MITQVELNEIVVEREQEWFVFVENREAVIAALQEGRCDGILPAARSFLDGFARFCLDAGILAAFEAFPDRRVRRCIPMFFFCNTLVYRPLFHLPRLKPIERTLFRSPFIMRQIGFNARQIHTGFHKTREGERPFTAQTIADTFARATPADFLANQQAVLAALWNIAPDSFDRRCGRWTAYTSTFPPGHIPRSRHSKRVCWVYGKIV